MEIAFYKYQGTGNDFILVDNRKGQVPSLSQVQIAHCCHRRFGIGADGFMLLQEKKGYDFEMVYYNSDGRQSSMCGNGGRCMVAFAHQLGAIENKAHFYAIDGTHEALLSSPNYVELKMRDVECPNIYKGQDYILDTGSPHYVRFVAAVDQINICQEGRNIRYAEPFKATGINVNFVEAINASTIKVATYERGVEDETYSCGTGVTAAALAHYTQGRRVGLGERTVQTKGGNLKIKFDKLNKGFKNIWLCGAATFVFGGVIRI